jgi:DNA-binding NarL/FixJ family response regulator
VIVTLLNPTDYFSEAIEAGAADYVLKDVPHYDLVSTVRRVLSGGKPPGKYRRGWHTDIPQSLPLILA